MRGDLLVAVAASLLCGCPGTIEDPSRFALAAEVDCPAAVDAYIAQACGSSCHSESDHQGQLDLETLPLDRLVGTGGNQSGCDGHLILDPDEPKASLLYLKLASDTPPCGERMPLVGDYLTPGQLDCVLEWIASRPSGITADPR